MNPVVPPGCTIMQQAQVTPDMTTWAVAIKNDTTKYPMYAFTVNTFGTTQVLAHVEWHPPDANNSVEHRGVTLYTVPASSTPAEGIDVSGFQPSINWPQVVAGGKTFAFIKATEGTSLKDGSFAAHWGAAKATGILRGAYHFFRPEDDAVAQAKLFLAQIPTDLGELPPVLDVEVTDNTPLATIAAGVSAWVNYVTAAIGGKVIIYSDPGFWNLLPLIPGISAKADLWVAEWGISHPTAVNGWTNWSFWQYTDKATTSGIPGTADQDDDRFNGPFYSLLAYASGSVAPPAPKYDFTTVKGIQQALIALGYNLGPTGADGDPGKLTRAAMAQFQLDKAVDFFDAVGPKTIAALTAAT